MTKPNSNNYRPGVLGRAMCLAFYLVLMCANSSFAQSKTIIDEWASVQPPKPPELKAAKIDDPKTTAYLVLDIIKQACNNVQRPRCIASVPKIQGLLKQARAKGLAIVYSNFPPATAADIIQDVASSEGEPIITARAEKFYPKNSS